MAFACNIDRQGKRARIAMGIVFVLIGLALGLLWALPTGTWFAWAVVVACLVGGAFGIFEGTIGWCAARAMGFKTRI